MVLPGIRGDQRTPGGMPDSGRVNPGGPASSVPQGTRQPNMGAGLGEPDPKKIEEMFTQYTTGQITREDLFNFLHTESEGRGGILGLLETIGQQSEQSGSQPIGSPGSMPPQPQPQPAAVENGKAISPGAASVPIPSLEEPLDKRHQKISMMLQGYGLGPADADQMSTLLNTHINNSLTIGHEDVEQEGGAFGPSAVETTQTVGVNPNLAGRREEWVESKTPDVEQEGGAFGPSATETVQTANVIPDLASQREDWVVSQTPDVEQEGGAFGPSATETQVTSWDDHISATPDLATQREDWEATRVSDRPKNLDQLREEAGVIPQHEGLLEPAPEKPAKEEPVEIVPGFTGHPGFQTAGGTEAVAMHGWSLSGTGGSEAVYQQFGADGQPLREFSGGKGGQKSGGNIYMGEDGKTFVGYPGPNSTLFRSKEDRDNFTDWQSQNNARGNTYWDGTPVDFLGFNKEGAPQGDFGKYTQFGNKHYYFRNEEDLKRFVIHRQWPDGSFVPGFEAGWPIISTDPNAPFQRGPVIDVNKNPDSTHGFGKDGMPTGLELDTASGRPTAGSSFNPDAEVSGGFGSGFDWGTAGEEALDGLGAPGEPSAAAVPGAQVDPTILEEARLKAPMLYEFVGSLTEEMMTPRDNDDIAMKLIGALSELDQLKIQGDEAARQRMSDVVVNALDRQAVTARADADRKFQQGVAIGELESGVTLAAIAEKNKQAFSLSQQSGYLPVWNSATQSWRVPTAAEVKGGQAVGGVEREALRITEEDKDRQYSMDLSGLFGTYVNPEGDPTKSMETIAMQQFGLTKALQIAETTGKIPTDWTGSSSFTEVDTFAMKRFAFEKDMSNRAADTADRLARNAEQTQQTNLTISNNRNLLERHIADGNLAEAVEARKDQTWLASQKLDLERDRMKLDTLTALANPASFLFAQRFGLLDDIGAALGIDWGEDTMDLPKMLPENYIPSLTEFQDATPMQREIMLAEMASAGGYTSNEAVRRIIEGAPGSRDIRRPSLLGAAR